MRLGEALRQLHSFPWFAFRKRRRFTHKLITELFNENAELRKGKRVVLNLEQYLNQPALPPYEHLHGMTDLGNRLFAEMQKAGLEPIFRCDLSRCPIPFIGIEITAPAGEQGARVVV